MLTYKQRCTEPTKSKYSKNDNRPSRSRSRSIFNTEYLITVWHLMLTWHAHSNSLHETWAAWVQICGKNKMSPQHWWHEWLSFSPQGCWITCCLNIMGSTHYKLGGGTLNGPKIKEEVEGGGEMRKKSVRCHAEFCDTWHFQQHKSISESEWPSVAGQLSSLGC